MLIRKKNNIVPVVIYSSEKALNKDDTQKLELWVKTRIKKNEVEVFWKNTK